MSHTFNENLNSIAHDTTLSSLDQHIIAALTYYDIFNYPLRSEEVYRFLGTNHTNEQAVKKALLKLHQENFIFQFGDFFSLQNKEANINRRKKGNEEAAKFTSLARRKGSVIARFPFVRAVLASGSLSKGYMDEKSDLDFFIITAPGRLWIARTLLVMYKRIFLFNSHKYFCVNYFIDTDHLEIEEKNLFTATELATVIPLCGGRYYTKLMEANSWLKKYFPNYVARPLELVDDRTVWLKMLMEKVISFFGGTWMERYFKQVTLNRWKNLYHAHYKSADFDVAFKTKDHVSKNHPNHYQKKVEELFVQRLERFDGNVKGTWHHE